MQQAGPSIDLAYNLFGLCTYITKRLLESYSDRTTKGIMRAARETRISTSVVRPRGRYCNMCGTRLERGGGLALFPSKHNIEWYDANETVDHAGRAATWSLCEECYVDRLKCASCGLQVGTQAFMLEGESRVYCRHCFEERPRCDTCGAPVGAHYWNRTDGRKLCDRCQTTVVSDRKQAEALYDGVRAILMRLLGVTLRV